MGRLRVTQFELEDASDDVIRTALTGLSAGVSRGHGTAVAVTEMVRLAEAPPVVSNGNGAHPVKRHYRKALAAPKAAPKAESNGTPAGMRQAPGGGDSIRMRIIEVLKKKPSSSFEMAEALNLEPKQVYQSCAAMKAAGLIEGMADEDGTRRWKIAGAK